MRYKNSDDNRYRVQFMRSTEELMDQLTVKEFISYLEENAEFEDYTVEYIDKKCVKCRAYDLTEENSKLHKEFLVTEDGRVFYWRSLISKIELVDAEEEKQEVQEVVVDFREAKEVAKEVAKELTEKDSNWKWRVQVLKSEIRVWWGYLQYCDTEDSHFTIKMSDRGAKYRGGINWYFLEKQYRYPTIELSYEECLNIYPEYGTMSWKDLTEVQAVLNSKIPTEEDPSQYVGQVGERLDLVVTFKKRSTYEIPSYAGWGTDTVGINIFRDDVGNCFIWKSTSAFFNIAEGIKGKIERNHKGAQRV